MIFGAGGLGVGRRTIDKFGADVVLRVGKNCFGSNLFSETVLNDRTDR